MWNRDFCNSIAAAVNETFYSISESRQIVLNNTQFQLGRHTFKDCSYFWKLFTVVLISKFSGMNVSNLQNRLSAAFISGKHIKASQTSICWFERMVSSPPQNVKWLFLRSEFAPWRPAHKVSPGEEFRAGQSPQVPDSLSYPTAYTCRYMQTQDTLRGPWTS